MAADPDTPDPEVARVVDEVADRAAPEAADAAGDASPSAPGGSPPDGGSTKAATLTDLTDARSRLDRAWHTSDSGTEIPDSARLRRAKQAVMVGLRPVTSHQVPFNRELVVAIDRLTRVVEEVVTHLDRSEERIDGVDVAVSRAFAGIATLDVTGADVDVELAVLRDRCDQLARGLEAMGADLAEQTRTLAATRAREDVVLRAVRDATGRGSRTGTENRRQDDETTDHFVSVAALAQEADAADARLLRRLGAAGRPPPEVLRAQARSLADVVGAAAASAPVLDLASDAGEWLDVWAERGIEATGVEDQADLASVLRNRGHAVEVADPVSYLRGAAPGAHGAITAAVLADVIPLSQLVALVDGAREALRPGGTMVLAAADPASQAVGDDQWADPRRRPLHPRTLALLVLERGWAEAEVVALDEGTASSYALVARAPGGARRPS